MGIEEAAPEALFVIAGQGRGNNEQGAVGQAEVADKRAF
jgi:hypothetical protein